MSDTAGINPAPATTVPMPSATASPGPRPGAVVGAAGPPWGSDGAAAPIFPRPEWWGEHGCRHEDETGHVCLDVFGQPPAETRRPCVAEVRAAMAELFETYRAVAC